MEYINLATGSSYFRSPGQATAATIAALQIGKTHYGPTEGTDKLRFAVAKRYQKQGITVTPEQVLITPGSKQALFNLFTVLLQDADEVIIPAPSWFGFNEIMQYCKGQIVSINTAFSDNYTLKPEQLQEVLTERSRVLLLTNPGNPTGRIYSKAELEALLEVTAAFPNLYIISDEIYDFVTYGNTYTSILSCEGARKEKTIVVNGFSKSFAMSGWRIGYMVGPPDVIEKSIAFQSSTLAGVSMFIQDGALATLEHLEDNLPQMLHVLSTNRHLMQDMLNAIPQVPYYLPDGAYYFFPNFKHYLHKVIPEGKEITTTIALCKYLREEYKLDLVPGDYFGAPGHARMSFAVEKHKLLEAMKRLQQALLQLK